MPSATPLLMPPHPSADQRPEPPHPPRPRPAATTDRPKPYSRQSKTSSPSDVDCGPAAVSLDHEIKKCIMKWPLVRAPPGVTPMKLSKNMRCMRIRIALEKLRCSRSSVVWKR